VHRSGHADQAERALSAVRRARDADPEGFANRHQDWHTWQWRAQLDRTLATTLDVPLEQISVIDDPQRLSGAVPGDLLIVTDPAHHRYCGLFTCP